MIPKDSNHKNVFRLDKLDNNVDTVDDDENTKIGKLRELNVSTSFRPEDNNAIVTSDIPIAFYP